jgi:hypothetical protein
MLERFTHTLHIGVAADALAVVETRRGLRPASTLLAHSRIDPAGGAAAIGQGLLRLLADLPVAGRAARVVLADELARLWQVAPPPAASRLVDLEAVAAMRFQFLYGSAAAGWRISADWDARRPFLAAALPVPLLAALQDAAAGRNVNLVEIAPQFVASLNGWRRQRRAGAWFGQVSGTVLTLAVTEGPALLAVRTAVVPAGCDRAWFDAHIAREAVLVGAAAPALVQVCGKAPRAWAGQSAGAGPDCMLLGAERAGDWSAAALLAATGSAA